LNGEISLNPIPITPSAPKIVELNLKSSVMLEVASSV
jgi:hypothetical protein